MEEKVAKAVAKEVALNREEVATKEDMVVIKEDLVAIKGDMVAFKEELKGDMNRRFNFLQWLIVFGFTALGIILSL